VSLEAREQAVQVLYQMDMTGAEEIPEGVEMTTRTRRLVEGVIAHRQEIDRILETMARHWSVERMPAVDRAVLRLGVYELRHRPDVPTAVVVSEAVKLAKAYSTEKSGRFVNGVLAAIARSERGES